MGSLIVRGLDDELIARLKSRAELHGRSAEAEHREILRHALLGSPSAGFEELAARMRALTAGRSHTPSEILQREGRDER
jgi:plasmid stability protein